MTRVNRLQYPEVLGMSRRTMSVVDSSNPSFSRVNLGSQSYVIWSLVRLKVVVSHSQKDTPLLRDTSTGGTLIGFWWSNRQPYGVQSEQFFRDGRAWR